MALGILIILEISTIQISTVRGFRTTKPQKYKKSDPPQMVPPTGPRVAIRKMNTAVESRDPGLSETSEIFKIGPIAKKLHHFKVGSFFWDFENKKKLEI